MTVTGDTLRGHKRTPPTTGPTSCCFERQATKPHGFSTLMTDKGVTAAPGHHASLITLPVEVLEIIAAPLSTADRANVTSACKGLWACPGVTSSAGLWGNVSLGGRAIRRGGGQQHTAAAWLARRRKALRRVRLDGWGADKLEVLLASLAGSTRLEALELLQWKLAEGSEAGSSPGASSGTADGSVADSMTSCSAASSSLELLLQLPGLAALSMECCGLAAVPAQVPALAPSLTSLSLAKNERLGRGSATALEGAAAAAAFCSAFQQLAALKRLARLDLSHCTLCVLPPVLSALPALEELLLAGNRGLGKSFAGGAATFQPLLALAPTLTRLDLGGCALEEVPPQVALLGRLAHLRLSNNEQLGSGGDGAFAPLAHLKAVTRLEVANSGLERVPRAEILAGMAPVLADLSIAGSWRLGRGLHGALSPLACLTALTRLDASSCRLETAPAELAALPRLAELDLSGNERFGGRQGALAALSRLASLARLDVRGCWQGAASAAAAQELAALQSLPGLKVVEVEGSGSQLAMRR